MCVVVVTNCFLLKQTTCLQFSKHTFFTSMSHCNNWKSKKRNTTWCSLSQSISFSRPSNFQHWQSHRPNEWRHGSKAATQNMRASGTQLYAVVEPGGQWCYGIVRSRSVVSLVLPASANERRDWQGCNALKLGQAFFAICSGPMVSTPIFSLDGVPIKFGPRT